MLTEQRDDFGSNHKTLQKMNTQIDDFGVEIAIIFGDDVGTRNFEVLEDLGFDFGFHLGPSWPPERLQVGRRSIFDGLRKEIQEICRLGIDLDEIWLR